MTPVDWKNKKADPSCRVTSTVFLHDNGCNPSLGQLQVEKRKACKGSGKRGIVNCHFPPNPFLQAKQRSPLLTKVA